MDSAQTAVILENLCAYSFGDLKQAYENDTLSFKYIRNKESGEMLRLIFATGRFKLTDAFGLNAMTDSLMDQTCLGNTSIASTLQKRINTYVKVLNTTVNNMLETDT